MKNTSPPTPADDAQEDLEALLIAVRVADEYQAPARKLAVGAILFWVFGAILTVGSGFAAITSAATVCDTVTCSLNTAMGMGLAGFGLFFGLVLVVLGFWSHHKADERFRRAERLAQNASSR